MHWQVLTHSAWMRALNFWLFPLMLGLVVVIFAEGTPRQMPVAVVDADASVESRALIRHLDASPALDVKWRYSSMKEAKEALRTGEVFAVVAIATDFQEGLRRGLSPEVVVFYNSQYLLAGKLASSALREAAAVYSAKSGAMLRIAYGQEALSAVAQAAAVRPQMTPLFNPAMSYSHFLGTAIAPALWQLFVVMASLLALNWRWQQGPLPQQRIGLVKEVIYTLGPVAFTMMIQAGLMLLAFVTLLGWQPVGHVGWILLGLLLMLLAIQAIALLLMVVIQDLVRALSISAAYLAPAFAFMGVTFPRHDMPALGQFWANLMPSTHYMAVQIAVADQGARGVHVLGALGALMVFGLLALAALWRLNQQSQQEETSHGTV